MSLRGHLAMSTDIFGCQNPGMGGGEPCYWKPRTLLNNSQCTGLLPQQRIVWPKMSIVWRLRNSVLGIHSVLFLDKVIGLSFASN